MYPTKSAHVELRSGGVYALEVRYRILTDPGAALPAWIVDLAGKVFRY
jgi:hypothetical protein